MFVLDKHRRPLQPCTPARARKLLKRGRAVVHRHTPFVIRLKDRAVEDSQVDGVEIGIDPGSEHTGISVFATENTTAEESGSRATRRGIYAIQIDHRGGQIRKKMRQRANYRRRRRSANLRYRAPRFNNRRRPEERLPPSLRHRVESTHSMVARITRWAPVRAIHIETVRFDPQKIANPEISGAEYQQGELAGYELKEYLLEKWGRSCVYCGATGVPLNVDHIRPRSRIGSSDRAGNLTIACIPCNQNKGSQPIEKFLANRPALTRTIASKASAPLHDAAAINATRNSLRAAIADIGLPVRSSTGGRTKWNRSRTGAPKTHTGQVVVRTSGSFGIRTHTGRIDGVSHTRCRVLQRADGWAYSIKQEEAIS